MSDELTPAPEEIQETPAENAAPDGTPAPDSEYTPERARGLHSELTKAQQELAEVKNQRELWGRAQQGDLDAMRELELPVQYEDDEPPEEDEDEQEFRDPRVDSILQQQETEQQQRFIASVSSHIDGLLSTAKVELPEAMRDGILPAVFAAAGDKPLTEQTTESVVKQWTGALDTIKQEAVKEYIASKRNAPFISPGGTGATEVTDPLDGKARRERLAARLDANGF